MNHKLILQDMIYFSGSTGGQYTSLSSSSLVKKKPLANDPAHPDPDHADLVLLLLITMMMALCSFIEMLTNPNE